VQCCLLGIGRQVGGLLEEHEIDASARAWPARVRHEHAALGLYLFGGVQQSVCDLTPEIIDNGSHDADLWLFQALRDVCDNLRFTAELTLVLRLRIVVCIMLPITVLTLLLRLTTVVLILLPIAMLVLQLPIAELILLSIAELVLLCSKPPCTLNTANC